LFEGTDYCAVRLHAGIIFIFAITQTWEKKEKLYHIILGYLKDSNAAAHSVDSDGMTYFMQ